MFKRTALSTAVALVLGGLPALTALADETAASGNAEQASDEGGSTLAKVVVTAQKREETAQEVPSSISVLSGDKVRDDSLQSANEVTRYIPNASAGTTEGHGRPRWWIRGLGTGDQGANTVSPVGIYVDDVYIANISATGFPLFDQERVEVLRGPQGTLWGKNTTAGAINFISRKPTFDKSGYFKVAAGNYDDRVVEGAISDALVDDRLAARLSFRHQAREGYNENIADNDDRGGLEDDAARLQFLARINDELEANLNLHARSYHDTAGYSTVNYGLRPDGSNQFGYRIDPEQGKVNYNAKYQVQIDQVGSNLNLNWQLGDLTLTSISAFEHFSRDGFSDSDNTPLELQRSYAYADSQQWSQEFRLASPREDRLNWVLGFHYFNEDLDSRNASAALDTPYVQRYYNNLIYSQGTESYALFGSSTFRFTDDFSVTAGLRWTRETKDIDLHRLQNQGQASFAGSDWWKPGSVTTPLVVNAVQDERNTWSDWTYDLTPEYRLSDNARVYFRYAYGFRSGGYNTGATSQATVATVDPEYLTAYELGLKSEWLDGRLNANAALFYYDYEDIQLNIVSAVNNQTVSRLANGAQGEAYGAEFELEAIPLQNLHLNFALGLLHTEFTDYTSGSSDYSGNKFVRAPNVSAVIGADYRIPLNVGGALILGTDWNTRSRQYFFSNDQSQNMRSGGYTLGNARVTYELPGETTRVTAYVNNLTDKEYRNHTLPGGFQSAGVMFGDPRTFGVSVTTDF
ncbi:iron complex outermembrane receptor protein [Pseudomonas citronellolis]|uniref:TonB-dependent receptor n=1 Tax=Pseudomonas citronellolis TaxID=53408 RepID=UPI00209C859F|nr:TonB-dependent receptor [Pseudomonas citronellolis]MCP1644527.1 iron complex outermembrane receptor protein [Pseudomonas citronellolis]MCP1667346.1 iron complex outermembrane receptor protein [Pseudomonas citronellolis]MCP1698423.1 iron complex outermembrane receptor protein [Pseudomonas citronellolis]MCP1707155.1 iron complex outermembrane receptor protein [Pseudomonas citronellolis]MCP1798951.1 iron complex outermembrane receptor protein [Pseudomonas citronellolis]